MLLLAIVAEGDVSWKAKPACTSAQLPDLEAKLLGEPEVAIGPRRDAKRRAKRRDRELSDLAGERQGSGSSKRKHADEQAQEPAEQEETQGEVTLFHMHTRPFSLARRRPDGRRKGHLSIQESTKRAAHATPEASAPDM